MNNIWLQKQNAVKELFSSCQNEEAKYSKIIELGRALPPLSPEFKTAQNQVKGCQSILFLHTEKKEGKLYFQASADALISLGLAALLIHAYSGEDPETILKCPPTFLEELGITGSLTPNRANGLYSIHLRMKQDALAALINKI